MTTTTTPRAPKKYLDADRIKINPAWLKWREELFEQAKEEMPIRMARLGIDPAIYFPEQYDKEIPEGGCWILVLEEPFTELRDRFRIPVLSMWRCRPHELNSGGFQIGVRGRSVRLYAKQAVIATPGGDLHLWPHEYSIVSNPYVLMSDPEAEIHELGGEPVLDPDMLFYLQSRGISHREAVMLLINSMTSTDYLYVTFPEEVTAQLDGVGQPIWRHVQRHPRRSNQRPQ